MFRFQVCGRRKPPRPSATPPWQEGEFKMKALLIKATLFYQVTTITPLLAKEGQGVVWLII
jgi:hypothetical protein